MRAASPQNAGSTQRNRRRRDGLCREAGCALNRWLLGFDVRLAADQYAGQRWDRDSRAQFLLRPDLAWPLSVDRSVWPSAFFPTGFRDFRDAYSTIPVDGEFKGNEWPDLQRMRSHFDAHRSLAPGGVFVGIELLSERAAEGPVVAYEILGGIQCGIWLDPTVPDGIPESSTRFGGCRWARNRSSRSGIRRTTRIPAKLNIIQSNTLITWIIPTYTAESRVRPDAHYHRGDYPRPQAT